MLQLATLVFYRLSKNRILASLVSILNSVRYVTHKLYRRKGWAKRNFKWNFLDGSIMKTERIQDTNKRVILCFLILQDFSWFLWLHEFDERFLISLNSKAFRGKMLFTDLASLPRPTLIDQVLRLVRFGAKACCHFLRDQLNGERRGFFIFLYWYPNRCIVFFSNGRISLIRIKQFVEIWWWPYLLNDTSELHHILCSPILKAQTCHLISSFKALMRKKSIECFVVFFMHSNITIIHDRQLCRRKKNCVGEIVRHLATRVNEHLITDRALHNHKHLERNESCSKLCSKHCFQVLDSAATEFEQRIKEAIHIKRKNPSLNIQVKHSNLKLSL